MGEAGAQDRRRRLDRRAAGQTGGERTGPAVEASTVVLRRTSISLLPSTRLTMPPIASLAHSPDGTSLA